MKRFFLCLALLVSTNFAHALMIYRPSNSGGINDIRCYLKIEDMEGNDVTLTAANVWYSWYDTFKTVHTYEKSPYLSGGMIMHIFFNPGTYKLTFYTPLEKQNTYDPSLPHTGQSWNSNTYIYNTEDKKLKAIFVSPVANENGFYTGAWHIDYKAPQYYIYTKPYRIYE